MSLTLYHAEPLANSLKSLIPLFEKRLPFESRRLNLLRFEQHEPWFLAINPEGQVPVLVHDGAVIAHTSVINEYLEDAFPDAPSLRPASPVDRARMRAWNKFVDEEVMAHVSTMGWQKRVGVAAREYDDAQFEAFVARIPLHEQRLKWRTARAGFPAEMLANAERKVRIAIDRVEAQLAQSAWLAGDSYSLADINYYAHSFTSLARLFPQFDSATDYPRATEWAARVRSRAAVDEALSMPSGLPERFDVSAQTRALGGLHHA